MDDKYSQNGTKKYTVLEKKMGENVGEKVVLSKNHGLKNYQTIIKKKNSLRLEPYQLSKKNSQTIK